MLSLFCFKFHNTCLTKTAVQVSDKFSALFSQNKTGIAPYSVSRSTRDIRDIDGRKSQVVSVL